MKKEIEWKGDLEDDCTAVFKNYMLRAEQMDNHYWWCVYKDGITLDDSNSGTFPVAKTGKAARRLAEQVFRADRELRNPDKKKRKRTRKKR